MEHYIRVSSLEALELEGQWVILHPEKYTVTKINEIGGLCWDLLKEKQTVDSLILEIGKQFEIEENHVKKDVEIFLKDMVNAGLILHAS